MQYQALQTFTAKATIVQQLTVRSNTSTHRASPSGTPCSSASLPNLDVEPHPSLLLLTLERQRARMELLSLTRSFIHLSYSNTEEESCLIPGSVSPETGSDDKISAWCQRQRVTQQFIKGFQVVLLWYYDFWVTFIKPVSYPFPKDKDYCHIKAGVSSDSYRMNL